MPATSRLEEYTPPFLDDRGTELVPLNGTRNEPLIPRQHGDSGLRTRLNRFWHSKVTFNDNTESALPHERRSFITTERVSILRRIEAIYENLKRYIYYHGSYLWNWGGDTLLRCWIVLLVSVLTEIYATALIKIATDESNLSTMLYAVSLYVISLFGFALALKQIDVSVAYAVWSALGTAAVSVFGIIMFGESCNFKKVISLIFIMSGVVGLNLQEDDH